MGNVTSEDVQHGLHSWIDYDRPWLLRRQFLVSQYHASVLSNLVAVALTLTGPRLWILIKALLFSVVDMYKRHLTRRRGLPTSSNIALQNRAAHLTHLENENLETTRTSHSEFGAALSLLRNLWNHLGSGRIGLPAGLVSRRKKWTKTVSRIWTNLIQRPFDIIASIFLSALFVGIFVAESSANVLSANIVSDTTALVSSAKCTFHSYSRCLGPTGGAALSYSQQCYQAPLGADGCNFFYNQSIGYKEKSEDVCPFAWPLCIKARNSTLTFDTGLVDASTIGVNSATRFQFRRTSTCAPLGSNSALLRFARRGNSSWSFEIAGKSRTWIIDVPGRITASRVRDPASKSPTLIHPNFFLQKIPQFRDLSFLLFTSHEMTYDESREDPVFPATSPVVGPNNITFAYANHDSSPTVVGCVDTAYLCYLGSCLNYPPGTMIPYDGVLYDGDQDPELGTRVGTRVPYDRITDAMLARILLTKALWSNDRFEYRWDVLSSCASRTYQSALSDRCNGLPLDQWKAEARRWFETSLARIQFNVLAISRGIDNERDFCTQPIPPQLRGLCSMTKFKSVGWRNVSVWGLFGLLFFSAGVSLASVKTETEELWLVVGTRHAYYILHWAFKAMKSIPWQLACTRVIHFVYLVGRGIRRAKKDLTLGPQGRIGRDHTAQEVAE